MNFMKIVHVLLLALLTLPGAVGAQVQQPAAAAPDTDPLGLTFQRLAARRFIFNNNITLAKLDPATVVALDLMHPVFTTTGTTPCRYALDKDQLVIDNPTSSTAASSLFIGAMNPYACYDIEFTGGEFLGGELALEFAPPDLSERIQVALPAVFSNPNILFRHISGNAQDHESVIGKEIPAPPFTLRVQLAGAAMNVFTVKDGVTTWAGAVEFRKFTDLRQRSAMGRFKFNIAAKLPAGSSAFIRRAESFLSAGMGQADIRMITRKDGSPYWENNRLWFTFSSRGAKIETSSQGVMSLDPSTFEPRFEGTIAYDRGDGLLRNDYASHIFYDDDAQEWRGWSCNFSSVADGVGREFSGVNFIHTRHDPRRGFSVIQESAMKNIEGHHEDPCGFFDAEAGKWRLLTSEFANRGIKAALFESDQYTGPWRRIAGPVRHDSTGTLIQKIGGKRYIFSGSSESAIFVYSYPDLKELGKLKMDLPPWNPSVKNARVWPNIFPLPQGFPYRYMALMMDRANFPGIKGGNWSYGALYLYGAPTDKINSDAYEFPGREGK